MPDNNALRLRILQKYHDTVLVGNSRLAKSFHLWDPQEYWNEMQNDVYHFVQNCLICEPSCSLYNTTFEVLRPVPVPTQPWEDISMGFFVGLPECEGFDAIGVVVKRLPKIPHGMSCYTTTDCVELAELLLHEVVQLYRLRLTIFGDSGPQFT